MDHGHHYPAALVKDWVPASLKYYKGLSRAQSTMLLQCRTECIGLNDYLFRERHVADHEVLSFLRGLVCLTTS